ncbi:cystathionine beta-lyase [Novosphingobium sp. Rr 2-17]|uniref:cystathionine beta-lyase n=1 Tax=Novosphingobium sp. Rr 2-17 TaxID=555793 RepID=UPI0005BA2B75|nr:cystathionine beta-lyase [Novosphingobium sp. Rr 2-17]
MIHPAPDGDIVLRTAAPVLQRGTTVLLDSCEAFGRKSPTYGRSGLATQAELRRSLCTLEQGEVAELYPSGLAALSGAILAVCRAGDEILICDTIYGPTRRFAESTMADYGVTTRYFPADIALDELEGLIGPSTRLIVLESPGSLTLDMMDIPALAALARSRGVLTLVDNTYAAGVLFKPLDHGIDISVQALTKYVCGHSDVFMGCAVARGEVGEMLKRSSRSVGWAVSSDDAYLALRGLRTLHARLARHGESALEVATWLAAQPQVSEVLCPALPGSRGHEVFKRDYLGGNGLVTIVLDAPESAATAFLDALRIFGLGFSWGGFESLAIPCNDQLRQRRFAPALEQPVIRLHVGLENTADLIAELRTALTARAEARI